ncbi:MAG: hypothetical protein U1E26_11660, partial [Coriobacteriia bacterium]|nr:hypothetical protein [Coriobacteriia bacterium]
PRVPEFLGVAAVVPVRVVAGRARAPDLLVATVAEAEARQGRRLQDVRSEELYYDAVSQSDDGVDIRYLVAREVDAGGDVWLTATEWAQLAHLGDAALLYVASDGGLGAITAAAVRQVAVEQQDRRCRLHLMAAVEPSRSTHATDGPV